MIVTEQEATKKWCPHARVVYSASDKFGAQKETPAYNRMVCEGEGEDAADAAANCWTECIGSRCMAWRWETTPPPPPPLPLYNQEYRGYCGLAYSVRLP